MIIKTAQVELVVCGREPDILSRNPCPTNRTHAITARCARRAQAPGRPVILTLGIQGVPRSGACHLLRQWTEALFIKSAHVYNPSQLKWNQRPKEEHTGHAANQARSQGSLEDPGRQTVGQHKADEQNEAGPGVSTPEKRPWLDSPLAPCFHWHGLSLWR